MVNSPKVSAVLLSLGLAASLVACSSGNEQPEAAAEDSRSHGQSSPTLEAGDDFSQGGMVVTAQCSPGDSGGGLVTVDGWNPQTLQKMAHAEFQLPDTVLTKPEKVRPGTALEGLCAPDSRISSGDILAVRSLFDRDFTKLAVVVQDPESMATHVGYVDRSSKLTDLTGPEDFGNTPHEDNAAMAPDGNAVWFTSEVDDTDRIASRAVTGDHKTDEQPIENVGESHLFVVGTPATAVVGGSARLSPDGKRLLAEGKLLQLPADRRVIGPEMIGQAPSVSCGESGSAAPIRWIDNDTVLCDGPGGRFSTLDVAPNAKPSAPILPANDHNNYVLGISPDGQRFAFLSVMESERHYYVSDLQPGSVPTKIEPPAEFSKMIGALFVLDWR
ncbi:hypothetical protein EV651_1042 [Kribbella sp. VKM Ac-2571]|nr:hypothetical protein EV651_1042 [Kribbella sp. VKM Ac-2571]